MDRGRQPGCRIVGRAAIVDAVERLGDFPFPGRPGRSSGTRELMIIGLPYLVVYAVKYRRDPRTIVILRVLHGANVMAAIRSESEMSLPDTGAAGDTRRSCAPVRALWRRVLAEKGRGGRFPARVPPGDGRGGVARNCNAGSLWRQRARHYGSGNPDAGGRSIGRRVQRRLGDPHEHLRAASGRWCSAPTSRRSAFCRP